MLTVCPPSPFGLSGEINLKAVSLLVVNKFPVFMFRRVGNFSNTPTFESTRELPDPERIREFEFPDPRLKFPIPISRELSGKAQWPHGFSPRWMPEIALKMRNSLHLPC